jgi:hypothetical protein
VAATTYFRRPEAESVAPGASSATRVSYEICALIVKGTGTTRLPAVTPSIASWARTAWSW